MSRYDLTDFEWRVIDARGDASILGLEGIQVVAINVIP